MTTVVPPADVSPILYNYRAALTDRLPGGKQQLQRYFPGPDGTDPLARTANDGLDKARSFVAFDWLVRVNAPAWLDLAGLGAEAQALRDLPQIVDIATTRAARPAITAAQIKATSRTAARDVAWDDAWEVAWEVAREVAWGVAWSAAWDAAWDAAGEVAWETAGIAAWDVAKTAAGVAAGEAARVAAGEIAGEIAGDVAWDVAWAAARRHLAPTVSHLQDSALNLFGALIAGRLTARTGDTE